MIRYITNSAELLFACKPGGPQSAQPGDELVLAPGLFDMHAEKLFVPDRCVVRADKQGQSIINRRAIGNNPAHALFKFGVGCELTGLSCNVLNGGQGIYGAVVTGGRDLKVSHCTFSGYTDIFYEFDGGDITIDSCELGTRWDAVVPGHGASGSLSITNSKFYYFSDVVPGAAGISCVCGDPNWKVSVTDCLFDGRNLLSNITGLVTCQPYGYPSGATISLTRCRFKGSSIHIFQSAGNTVNAVDCQYDPQLVVGTVNGAPVPAGDAPLITVTQKDPQTILVTSTDSEGRLSTKEQKGVLS